MNNTLIDTKAVILSLQKVKKEKKLSLEKIYKLVEDKDPSCAVSRTTIARVFRDGAETQIFKWEASLRPIANALLDMEEIEIGDDIDTQAMKSILKLKKDLISELEAKLQTVQNEEKLKYHKKLETETAKFQKSLDFLREQIDLKDKRIDLLMNANDRLSITNDRLIHQLMDCPLRKDCK